MPTDTIVTFGPGETVKPVDIPIINDDVTEPTETFFAILNSTASNVIVPADSGQAVITIVDIDGKPLKNRSVQIQNIIDSWYILNENLNFY